jgi:hypothetical protein
MMFLLLVLSNVAQGEIYLLNKVGRFRVSGPLLLESYQHALRELVVTAEVAQFENKGGLSVQTLRRI